MKILLLLLILVYLILLFYIYKTNQQKSFSIDKNVEKYNDNTDEFKDLIEKYKSIKNNDEWWEPCTHCAFFDGYDMCLVHNNFGAVTDVSKARCESEKLFKEK